MINFRKTITFLSTILSCLILQTILLGVSVEFGHCAPVNNLKFQSFKTQDELSLRYAHMKADGKKRGTIILLEGMGGFIESYEGLINALCTSGFDVHIYDSRGQGASTRITKRETLLHINSFDDYIQDLHTYLNLNQEFERPLIFVGMSMGGHVALRYAHEYPHSADALILLAPMVEINTGYYPRSLARMISSVMSTIGAGERFVLGYDTYSFETCLDKYDRKKNGDFEKYKKDCQYLHEKPYMAVGGPSFNWLNSAFKSCDKLKGADFSSSISIPVMFMTVEDDHLVETNAQIDLCKALPNCKQILYKDAHHNILKEGDDILERVYKDINAFITELPERTLITPKQELVMDNK